MAAAKCGEVGEKAVNGIRIISKVLYTVENHRVAANGYIKKVVTVQSEVWWLKLRSNPFNTSDTGMLFNEGVIEELQSC